MMCLWKLTSKTPLRLHVFHSYTIFHALVNTHGLSLCCRWFKREKWTLSCKGLKLKWNLPCRFLWWFLIPTRRFGNEFHTNTNGSLNGYHDYWVSFLALHSPQIWRVKWTFFNILKLHFSVRMTIKSRLFHSLSAHKTLLVVRSFFFFLWQQM